jgi:hypothetical protein
MEVISREGIKADRRYNTLSIQNFSCIGEKMKIVLNVAGILLVLAGGVWFLQGINILPGSFMTGQIRWAIYGGLAVLIGAGLLVFANRRKSNGDKNE